MNTFHSQTIRDAVTRNVIERARAAGGRMVIDAGYRCISAWRLGRQAPREEWALVREFSAA